MPLEGATHAVQLSKAAASEMRRVIQRAADTEVTDVSQAWAT